MFIAKICDNRRLDSISSKLRQRRFRIFANLVSELKHPVRILDVGGTPEYWKNVEFVNRQGITVSLLNLHKTEVSNCGFETFTGDVRDMSRFKDREFDVVFSNSVIEHLGKFEDQLKAANEIRRVGKRYFVQTPNYYFPIEPHFLFPMFQFFPERLKTFLVMHFDMGWIPKETEKGKAQEVVRAIRLLTRRELQKLFPGALIYEEKFLGFTKSFVTYKFTEE